MSREEDLQLAIETLRGSAPELGGEAELLANELASLTRRPPSLGYKDFDNTGAEEELSDGRDSTDRGVVLERLGITARAQALRPHSAQRLGDESGLGRGLARGRGQLGRGGVRLDGTVCRSLAVAVEVEQTHFISQLLAPGL